ncbi:Tigger transposable element-derived protein 4 [Dictyocoela muelleri]|nr:Tigger transposable element-derived protein 4 [Dictyocoela muelleri]
MQNENRKIALFLDNATCHITYEKFSNIEIISLPKNITTLIQPLDQGIIKSFKDKYKNIFVSSFLFNSDLEKNYDQIVKNITVSDALSISSLTWAEVIEETIKNCYQKSINYQNKEFVKTNLIVGNENELKNENILKNENELKNEFEFKKNLN